jgi:hypothetical protein
MKMDESGRTGIFRGLAARDTTPTPAMMASWNARHRTRNFATFLVPLRYTRQSSPNARRIATLSECSANRGPACHHVLRTKTASARW